MYGRGNWEVHRVSLNMGSLVSTYRDWFAVIMCHDIGLTFDYRAGGPGDSKEDVKWLDEKLKVFFADGSFP